MCASQVAYLFKQKITINNIFFKQNKNNGTSSYRLEINIQYL